VLSSKKISLMLRIITKRSQVRKGGYVNIATIYKPKSRKVVLVNTAGLDKSVPPGLIY
jgi:hypothetical protein